MSSETTEAWVLYSAAGRPGPGELIREEFTISELSSTEVLAKPLFGCVEGNMLHALQRDPVDICEQRKEERVVLGNSGVVEVKAVGDKVTGLQPGDVCLVFGNAEWDDQGYPIRILGFDAPGTMGVLARTMKLPAKCLIPIPKGSRYSLQQWAAFSLRYISAWANWRVALACWQSQMTDVPPEQTTVCAWGGGVSYAQLTLARKQGYQAIMIASQPQRLAALQAAGLQTIDRSRFNEVDFEQEFLNSIAEKTEGKGVSIFIDNIGKPVHALTLKALARQGVLATCGWKGGMRVPLARAIECLSRHIHVHTHYARYAEGLDAVAFAEEHDWMAPPVDRVWSWDEIPQLFNDYAAGRVATYFPVFSINE